MKIAIGADMDAPVVHFVSDELQRKGHEVEVFPVDIWPSVGITVAERVAIKEFDQAVVFCWTGTGISIAANKVKGIRAALCQDAETARGARLWNDANILALSIRTLSNFVAKEILEAWLSTTPSITDENQACLQFLAKAEEVHR